MTAGGRTSTQSNFQRNHSRSEQCSHRYTQTSAVKTTGPPQAQGGMRVRGQVIAANWRSVQFLCCLVAFHECLLTFLKPASSPYTLKNQRWARATRRRPRSSFQRQFCRSLPMHLHSPPRHQSQLLIHTHISHLRTAGTAPSTRILNLRQFGTLYARCACRRPKTQTRPKIARGDIQYDPWSTSGVNQQLGLIGARSRTRLLKATRRNQLGVLASIGSRWVSLMSSHSVPILTNNACRCSSVSGAPLNLLYLSYEITVTRRNITTMRSTRSCRFSPPPRPWLRSPAHVPCSLEAMKHPRCVSLGEIGLVCAFICLT